MGKSMYSLILSDEVVRAADRMAYEQGMSRSSFIDQVLARHLSISTPEQQVEDIFFYVANALEEGMLQIAGQPSSSMLQMRSVLRYKYNPTIRYAVEISPGTGQGALRVSARTTSAGLISRLDTFYRIWNGVEQACYQKQGWLPPKCEIQGGRYSRTLQLTEEEVLRGSQELGELIGAYVRLMHSAMERFFEAPQGMDEELLGEICAMYENYLWNTSVNI